MNYRPEIDGLRAIAVVAVILFHAGFRFFGGGYIGVDVFFVISGFLITSVLISQKRAGTLSLAHFYERRARRIIPALYAVMGSSILLAWLWLTPDEMQRFSKNVVAVSLFLGNISFWQESGYFDTAAALKPLLHTWSLGIEEQFYVLLPIFLALTWNLGRRWVVGLLATVGTLSLALADWGAVKMPAAAFFLLPMRAWELVIGSLVAFRPDARGQRAGEGILAKMTCEAASLLGLSMILYSIVVFGKSTPFPSLYTTIPTIGSALVIIFAVPGTIANRLLSIRPLVGVGLASYSAYLWHHILFVFARQRSLEEPSTPIYIVLFFIVAAVSYLSWKFVETPFRSPGRISRRRVMLVATLGAGVFVVFGVMATYTGGFALFRTTEAQRMVLATATWAKLGPPFECNTTGTAYIETSDADVQSPIKATWAAFGDSHIGGLAKALTTALQSQGTAVKQFSCNSCNPSFGATPRQDSCWNWTQTAAAHIAHDPDIEYVVVTYRLTSWDQESNPRMLDEVWGAYINVLKLFVESGKKVIVVLQAPELREWAINLIFKNWYSPNNIAGVRKQWWDERLAADRKRFDQIRGEVVVVDPAAVFCDEDVCAAVKDGTALYCDNSHMSIPGAALVVQLMLESINSGSHSVVAIDRPEVRTAQGE